MAIQRTVMSVQSKHVNIRDIHPDNPVIISIEMPHHPSKTALRVLIFEVELLLNDLSPCSRDEAIFGWGREVLLLQGLLAMSSALSIHEEDNKKNLLTVLWFPVEIGKPISLLSNQPWGLGEDWPREREMYNGCKGYCVTVMKDGWDKSGADTRGGGDQMISALGVRPSEMFQAHGL
ncbi:unnamed protein product [Leuciscus chuanchicus]